MTFAGLRSRCTTFRSCAAARPAQIWRAISSARSSGNRPMRLSSDDRSSPSTYSIERNVRAVDLVDVVHAADVRVRDLPRHPHFGVELRQARRVAIDLGREELERDRLPELQVVRAIDLAHAATAEPFDDAIAPAKEGARFEAAVVDRAGSRASRTTCLKTSGVSPREPRSRKVRSARVASSMPRTSRGITVSMAACSGSGVWHFGHSSPASWGTMTAAHVGQQRMLATRPLGV